MINLEGTLQAGFGLIVLICVCSCRIDGRCLAVSSDKRGDDRSVFTFTSVRLTARIRLMAVLEAQSPQPTYSLPVSSCRSEQSWAKNLVELSELAPILGSLSGI